MARANRRSLENDVSVVLNWLNNESGKKDWGKNTAASRTRINDLVVSIQELNELARKKLKKAGRLDSPRCYFCNNFPAGKMKRLLSDIEARISEYPTSQIVYMDCSGRAFVDDGALAGEKPIGEAMAAHWVCRLTNIGQIDRIGLCQCGRYFFGKFGHQRYCRRACKQKHHQASPKYKHNRREYMRWYYAMYQSPKQPSRKLSFEAWRAQHIV